jgi:hypothetical protein
MQPFGIAGKCRTLFSAGLIANGHDIIELFTALDKIGNAFRTVLRDIDAFFSHHRNDRRIKFTRRQSGALGKKTTIPKAINVGLGHLTAGAVVDADKKDFNHVCIV